MRNASVVGLLMAVGFCAVSQAAPENGPGGRLYFSGKASAANWDIMVKSVKLNPNWTLNGAFESHGTFTNGRNDSSGYSPMNGRFSPEIETRRDDGYADLVMGLWYNNTPAPSDGGVTAGYQTMDILRIKTSPNSSTVEILGDGRNSNVTAFAHTEGAHFAMPDPSKRFLTNGGYFVWAWAKWNNVGNDYRHSLFICRDSDSDGDCTDDTADYTQIWNGHPAWDNVDGVDHEIVDGILYCNPYWGPIRKLLPNGTYSDWSPVSGTNYASVWPSANIAAGKVKIGGVDRPAVWYLTNDNNWEYRLRVAVDKNGDGDATDAGEVDVLMQVANPASPEAHGIGVYSELEFVTNSVGTRFLLALLGDQSKLVVLQLNDDGTYTTGVGHDAEIALGTNANNGTYALTSFELMEPLPKKVVGSIVLLR